jgi:surface antigen
MGPIVKKRNEAEALRQADLKATADRMQPKGTYGNTYAALNCTWYVASRISVPAAMGNANHWDDSLAALGWRSGEPRRGAVAETDAGWAGHVAIVEEAIGGMVKVSEYNYVPFSYDERWVSAGEFKYFYQ